MLVTAFPVLARNLADRGLTRHLTRGLTQFRSDSGLSPKSAATDLIVASGRDSYSASASALIVQLAWMPMLALTGETRRWEPRRLRLRLFSAAAQLVTTARRRHLRFARHWPWTDVITDALTQLETLPNPG